LIDGKTKPFIKMIAATTDSPVCGKRSGYIKNLDVVGDK
jgi:hypothetical protein